MYVLYIYIYIYIYIYLIKRYSLSVFMYCIYCDIASKINFYLHMCYLKGYIKGTFISENSVSRGYTYTLTVIGSTNNTLFTKRLTW